MRASSPIDFNNNNEKKKIVRTGLNLLEKELIIVKSLWTELGRRRIQNLQKNHSSDTDL